MDQQRRLLLFFTLSLAILIGWSQFVVPLFFPLPPGTLNGPVSALRPENGSNSPVADAPNKSRNGEAVAAQEPEATRIPKHPPKTVVLGSSDPSSEFFLSVQLTSLGAAVDSITLNDPRYPEIGARGTPLTLVGHNPAVINTLAMQLPEIDRQLGDEDLEAVHWKLVTSKPDRATFEYVSPDGQLKISKEFSLTPVPLPAGANVEEFRDSTTAGYELQLAVRIQNQSDQTQTLSYSLRGPVGLPLEDPDNSSKYNDIRLGFLRDGGTVDHSTFTAGEAVKQLHAANAGDEFDPSAIEIWKRPVQYIGVDTQYFAALVHPLGDQLQSPTIHSSQAVVVRERKEAQFADVSVLLTSSDRKLGPAGAADGSDVLEDRFVLYAGPKRETLLEPLKASPVLDYGWFAPLVRVMLGIVHSLHALGLSYGLAIIGLTCLVRAAMIPLTRHQAKSMDKMKELQPKIKSLHEKYKKDPASLTPEEMRQMQEVNLKMFAGCLPLFLQMPIFIALYRALQVSVDLRMAPFHLFGNWIDNLASPDALFQLGFTLPFVGWTTFNLLPILSIVLMQLNQKLTMPPPADEEQAMQYRMMNIMMYVMVVFFYRVPAGLCLYFIVSSIWGTTERLLMKRFAKSTPPGSTPAAESVAAPKPSPSTEPPKRSMFGDFRAKLRELQELADKEASARRDAAAGEGRTNPKKQRGRR